MKSISETYRPARGSIHHWRGQNRLLYNTPYDEQPSGLFGESYPLFLLVLV